MTAAEVWNAYATSAHRKSTMSLAEAVVSHFWAVAALSGDLRIGLL